MTPGHPGHLDRTRVSVAAGPLAAPVLARLVGIHAARAGLTLERLHDAVLITDALAQSRPATAADGRLTVSIQSVPGRIELRVGPLAPGATHRVLEEATLPDTGPLVHGLADEVHVRAGAGGGETLVVRVAAGREALPGPAAG